MENKEGYVYVLSNESMPGIYKIGATTRPIGSRIYELSSSTGVPTPFKEEFSLYVSDMFESEHILHKELEKYRINKDREFFKADLSQIQSATRLLYEDHSNTINKFKDTIQKTGEYWFKYLMPHILNKDKDRLIANNFKFDDSYNDVYYKDGIYYKVELATPIYNDADFFKWKNEIIKSEKLIKFHNTYVRICKSNKKYKRAKPLSIAV